MPKLKIYQFPDDVLAKSAKPVDAFDKTIRTLADDMLETMYDAPGIGLAANQVGVLSRVVVIDTEYEVTEEDVAAGVEAVQKIIHAKPKILINPEIEKREGKIIYCEGCLSVPGFTSEVERAKKITIRYQDLDGLEKKMDAEDLQAIALQHELDHLAGKLFIDRLSLVKKQLVKRKLLKERLEQGDAPRKRRSKRESGKPEL